MAQIGIKLADHTFYPVIDDEKPQKKRVVLTAAQEGQQSIQVDLIRRSEGIDQSVGTLVLEDVPDDSSQEFEFIIGIESNGTVTAEIKDAADGRSRSISVDLNDLQPEDSFSLPEEEGISDSIGGVESLPDNEDSIDTSLDFDLPDIDLPESDEGDFASDIDSTDIDSTGFDSTGFDFDSFSTDEELEGDRDLAGEESEPIVRRPFNPLLLIAILLVSLSLLALGAFGVFSWLKAEPIPELRASFTVIDAAIQQLT